MKKAIYLLATVLMLTSPQLSASFHDMEYWQGVHQKATLGDHEAAYEMGVAWKIGNQGLPQNKYKSLLSHIFACKKGNEKSREEIMKQENRYRTLASRAIDQTKSSGSSLICFGLYEYKGFAKYEKGPKLPKYSLATFLFEHPIIMEQKRKENSEETRSAQKKWIARGYMWLAIMLSKKEITLEHLHKSTWENLNCGEKSTPTEIAHAFLEKAVEFGCYWAKQKLEIVKQKLEIERQVTEDN